MKTWHVEFSESAHKFLKKMDPGVRGLMLKWIRKNLEGCDNPRAHGKGLSGNLAGLWRYRVGDFRLIAEIQDDRLVILMIEIGHRSEVYN